MKFVLAFVLAICAVSAHPSMNAVMRQEAELFAVFDPVYMPMPRDGVFDTIREYVESAIASVKETVTNLVEKAKEQGAAAQEKILDVVKNAADKVAGFVLDTEAKITDLTNKGLVYKECAQKFKPKFDALYEAAKQEVKQCTTDALENAEKLHGNVLNEVEEVKKYVAALRDAIKTCYQPSSPVASVTCAVSKAKEVKAAIAAVIESATNVFNGATSIVSDSVSCVKDSLAANKAKAEALVEEVKACAAA